MLGPLLFSPLSEIYGRRLVLVPTFVLFTAFTGACGAARNWPSFLVFRLICGINASSLIAITSGIYADILEDPVARGRAIAFYISVGQSLDPINMTCPDTALGNRFRSSTCTHRLWCTLFRWLEMGILGCVNHRSHFSSADCDLA